MVHGVHQGWEVEQLHRRLPLLERGGREALAVCRAQDYVVECPLHLVHVRGVALQEEESRCLFCPVGSTESLRFEECIAVAAHHVALSRPSLPTLQQGVALFEVVARETAHVGACCRVNRLGELFEAQAVVAPRHHAVGLYVAQGLFEPLRRRSKRQKK